MLMSSKIALVDYFTGRSISVGGLDNQQKYFPVIKAMSTFRWFSVLLVCQQLFYSIE